ncbi:MULTISPECIES: M48 family metallopeptidase [Prosthecochloris]|nr:YgjP-like metallopeptidase domain-containing protein [Prosthecochloris sp. ZM_2]
MLSYTVKVNRRLKHPRLTMLADGRLIVQVPPGFDTSRIESLVQGKSSWIQASRRQLNASHAAHGPGHSDMIPRQLVLHSVDEVWSLSYDERQCGHVEARESGTRSLQLSGEVSHHPSVHDVLRAWLKQKAFRELVPWIERLADRHEFRYSGATVRHQKTRWGSFSSQGRVSLNMKLLFLPPHLVTHVLLHELCHSVHPDHSRDFWRLLERHDPLCDRHRQEIRLAGRYVPLFVDLALY